MLENIPFFKNLSSKDITKLENISISKEYKKDEFLFMQGEESKWLHILVDGSVELYKNSPKNKKIFIHDIKPINFIAEIANFEKIPYPASAVFSSNGAVLKLEYDKFESEFMQNPKIVLELLKSITQKLKIVEHAFDNELMLSSDEKLAKFIVENFDLFTTLKQSRVANILNIAPETLSRSISKFKKDGVFIYDDSGKIVDFKENQLKNLYEI
ncbi:MAG: Crp/Fnr family transcriptional regulator [Campylobacter sp.]|nr:Crp/Fnr family transcriptional regulator [Campylobacter sp.]